MAQDGLWHSPAADPPYKKTGEVWDQVTVELLTDCLLALGGTDGTSGFAIPIGGEIAYSGTVAPSSWWGLVDGVAISRTTYAKLFTAQGTNYGAGDGSTTFNKPDKRFRGSVGLDNMGSGAAGRAGSHTATQGGTGGETDHALTGAETGSHSHSHNHTGTVTDPQHTHPLLLSTGTSSTNNVVATANGVGDHYISAGSDSLPLTQAASTGITVTVGTDATSAGSGTAHNNMAPYQCDLWIMRLL